MSLSSRAVAVAASTGCPRLRHAARAGKGDTTIAKARGLDSLSPRLAFLEGQEFERRAIGRNSDDDPALLELLDATSGTVVRFPDTTADEDMLAAFNAAVADPAVSVVVQGVLPGLYGEYHRPDLMIRNPDGSWDVGEVKVYLDRGGDTPARLVQSTATQVAVSVVAGRRHGMTLTDNAVIVLASQRGTPSVRRISISGEVELVQQLLDVAPPPARAHDVPADLGEHIYSPACEGLCALADLCREETLKAPGVLWAGDTVASTYGWKHVDLLGQCLAGMSPDAVQAGWDAAGV